MIAAISLSGCSSFPEKGYDLSFAEAEQREAATDCKKKMGQIQSIYERADKGEASNVVLQDETMLEMQKALQKTGHPVSVTIPYCDMENYEKSDRFLKDCENGRSGSAVIYEIR